jgi:hypothetical protein
MMMPSDTNCFVFLGEKDEAILSVWHQGVYGDFTKDKPYMLTLLV